MSILICSQYARQLSYIECRVSNSFKTATLQCDCEKTSNDYKGNTNTTLPHSKNHSHTITDECFTEIKLFPISSALIPSLSVFNGRYLANDANDKKKKIDRPPQL